MNDFTISAVARVLEKRGNTALASDLILANRYSRQTDGPHFGDHDVEAFLADPSEWASRNPVQYSLLKHAAQGDFGQCQTTGDVILTERGGTVVKMPATGRAEPFKTPQTDYSKRQHSGPKLVRPARMSSPAVEAEQARIAGKPVPDFPDEPVPQPKPAGRRSLSLFGGKRA